jgi:hypothetical protein
MAKKKKQTRNKARSHQTRQKHELKRRQKKKALSASKPSAGANEPFVYDPTADNAYLESLSPEMREQIQAIEASSASARKTKGAATEESAQSPDGATAQSPQSITDAAEAAPADAPGKLAQYPVPPGMPPASAIFDFRGVVHPSMFHSKRFHRFVNSLIDVMDEVGHDGKRFNMYDVKRRANRTFLGNLVRRKVQNENIDRWQKTLLDQVHFDWTYNTTPHRNSSKSKWSATKYSRIPPSEREKLVFSLPGDINETVIFLDVWEDKLSRFETVQQTVEKVNAKVMLEYGLTNWITETRKALAAEVLPEKFIERLRAAGFDFKPYQKKTREALDAHFDAYCERVAVAQKKFGTTIISPKMDKKLHLWINKQRWNYNRGVLREDQIKALNKLGLLRRPKMQDLRQADWLKKFEAIKKTLEENSDNQVSPDLDRLYQWQKQWLRHQQYVYRKGSMKPQRSKLMIKAGLLEPLPEDPKA